MPERWLRNVWKNIAELYILVVTEMKKSVLIAAAAVVWFVCSGAAEAEPAAEKPRTEQKVMNNELNAILASVNGEPISLGDVLPLTHRQEQQAFVAYSGVRLFDAIRELRRKAVDELIDRKLIIADYYKQHLRIPRSEIEAELDRAAIRMNCRSRSEFLRKLRENGADIELIRKQLEENLIVPFMLFRKRSIGGDTSPRKLFEYFVLHEAELAGVESIELAMLKIEASRPGYKDICREISAELAASPQNFSALVQKYNGGKDDGRLGNIERSKLRSEFAAALHGKTLAKGFVSAAITVDDASGPVTVWLRVIEHHVPQKILFADVEAKIVENITREQRRKERDEYTTELRRSALIEYFF